MRSELFLIVAALCWSACESKDRPSDPNPPQTKPPAASADEQPTPAVDESTLDAPGAVVAIGDVHGDFDALQTSLKLAKLIDDDGNWSGGETTLVQTGDLLDRGDDEQQIVDYLHGLREEAREAGGRVVLLLGNHEVMNVAGDLRYVTRGGFTDFEDVEGLDTSAPVLQRLPEGARARMAAFMPGGPYAIRLAEHHLVIAIVDETVFAHGGVLPHHVEYGIDEINSQTSAWMRGERDVPMVLQGEDAPIWTRVYSDGAADCGRLHKTLDALGVERLVVGHTVQKDGITSACDGSVWRIDVGMSEHYGGEPAALRIRDGRVQVVE